jgi:hypothetical protein
MTCPTFKRLFMAVSLLLLILLAAPPVGAAVKDGSQAAQKAALAWLTLVDQGKYRASWQESGAFFQGAMDAEKWDQLMQGVRKPLGKTLSRKFFSAQARQTMPGAPDGQYFLLLFKTSFAKKKSAEERVTLIQEKGRGWRVVGYFIK